MKHENAPVVYNENDQDTKLLYAMIHLAREAGFSDGFFSPEQQSAFLNQLETLEVSFFTKASREKVREVINWIDRDIKEHSVDYADKKSLKNLKTEELKEEAFAAAIAVVKGADQLDLREVEYLERLKTRFHFSEKDVSNILKKHGLA